MSKERMSIRTFFDRLNWWVWAIAVAVFFILGGVAGWFVRSTCCCCEEMKTVKSENDQLTGRIEKMSALLEKAKHKIEECKHQVVKTDQVACPSIKIRAGDGLRIVKCRPRELCE